MNESQQHTGKKLDAGKKGLIILGAVLVVAVIVGIVLSITRNRSEDLTIIDGEQVVSKDLLLATNMEPASQGEYVYNFEGIEWAIEPLLSTVARVAETSLSFQLVDFSRLEGRIISFNNPYKLGNYRGDCEQVPAIERHGVDFVSLVPVSFVSCTDALGTTEIGVFQDSTLLRIMKRAIAADGEVGSFSEIKSTTYPLDMTTIVQ